MPTRKQETKRYQLELLKNQLDIEYNSFDSLYRDINDFILPSEGRFQVTDYNRGNRRDLEIINTAATRGADILDAGMMSGITSPAKPWFKLGSPDPDLNRFGPVKQWLELVQERMFWVFAKSNFYQAVPYRGLGGFGTAAMSVEYDVDNTIHCHQYPIGSYRLAKDHRGMVNTFSREWAMTVRNVVDKFGERDANGKIKWDNISTFTKGLYERGNYEHYVIVAHVIFPNEDYDPGSPFSKHKKFKSVYYERGLSGKTGQRNYMDDELNMQKLLRESGFDIFPVLAPRWRVGGSDVYATDCPGIKALGHSKQLQHTEKKFGKALDIMVDPTMIFPTSLINQEKNLIPGGIMYHDQREGQDTVRSAYDVNLRLDHLAAKQEKIEQQIREAFYENLFLIVANEDRTGVTAKEIAVREQEKLFALGPVLQRVNFDLNDPFIDLSFAHMLRNGMIPPPPEELQGLPLKVEYVSLLAEAQKAIGMATHERFLSTFLEVSAVAPEIRNKVNIMKWVERYAEGLSIKADVIRSDEDVQALEQAQAEAQKSQALLENAPGLARAAKDLSEADTEGENALTAIANGL